MPHRRATLRQSLTSSTSSWCQLIYPLLRKNTIIHNTHMAGHRQDDLLPSSAVKWRDWGCAQLRWAKKKGRKISLIRRGRRSKNIRSNSKEMIIGMRIIRCILYYLWRLCCQSVGWCSRSACAVLWAVHNDIANTVGIFCSCHSTVAHPSLSLFSGCHIEIGIHIYMLTV